MKYLIYLITGFALLFVISAPRAHAAWSYSDYTINYDVIAQGSLIANAGPDVNLAQPNAGKSGIVGTASSSAGTITSTSWSYVNCSIKNADGSRTTQASCPNPGMVVSGANGSSSPLQATMANMGGAAVDTHFTYKFSATDSAGNTGIDYMDIIITAASAPDLIAGNVSPASATAGTPQSFSSTITNQGDASTGSSFSNFFQVATAANGGGAIIDLSPSTMTALAATTSNTASASYTFSSSGTYSIRACADKSNAASTGTISESNAGGTGESNNCSPTWTTVNVQASLPPPPPTSYTITASSGANGSVAPSGATSVSSGGSQTYTITPAAGYQVASVTVDGSSVGAVSSYNFSNVTANHTISATFSAAPAIPACSDGIDNDNPPDGKVDYNGATINGVYYPPDPGCSSSTDNSETDPKPVFIEF